VRQERPSNYFRIAPGSGREFNQLEHRNYRPVSANGLNRSRGSSMRRGSRRILKAGAGRSLGVVRDNGRNTPSGVGNFLRTRSHRVRSHVIARASRGPVHGGGGVRFSSFRDEARSKRARLRPLQRCSSRRALQRCSSGRACQDEAYTRRVLLSNAGTLAERMPRSMCHPCDMDAPPRDDTG
jgi:hypothetical protein